MVLEMGVRMKGLVRTSRALLYHNLGQVVHTIVRLITEH